MTQEQLNWLTSQTLRSVNQTKFLYDLLDKDFEKLKNLEVQLKNCFCSYCPGNMEEVEKVLSMTPKNVWFKLK